MGRAKEILDDERNVVDEASDEMLLVGGGREPTRPCFVGRNPIGARGCSWVQGE